jgi:hypothetical protein
MGVDEVITHNTAERLLGGTTAGAGTQCRES